MNNRDKPSNQQSNRRQQEGTCPITFGLDIFGDKWSLLIIRDMLFKGKRYYGEFLKSPEQISTNILANRLGKLESQGIISKIRDANNQKKNIYRLTQKGKELVPVILEIIEWSTKYDPQPDVPDNIISGAPSNLLHRSRSNRNGLVKEIWANLEE